MYQIDLEQWMLGEAADFGANITDVREFLVEIQMLIT
jgi:hypothetical protein